MTQIRWYCRACTREWVYAYHWTPAQGCPACRSAAIEQVTYQPVFLGADIPRDGTTQMTDEPIAVDAERNWAVELSGALL